MHVSLVTVFCVIACTGRALAQSDVSDVDWLRQYGADLGDEPIGEAEVMAIEVSPTLDALASNEGWGCRPSDPKCLRTFWKGKLAGPVLREARVVGEHSEAPESTCAWRLVVHSDVGWLRSLSLGNSPRDCATPLETTSFGSFEYWFPRRVSADAHGIRIEAQGEGKGDNWYAGKYRIDHIVDLCRIEANALVCGRDTSPGRPVAGNADALAKGDADPLLLTEDLLPLGAQADSGARIAASYLGVPDRPGLPAHIAVRLARSDSRVFAWPFDGGRIVLAECAGRPGWDDAWAAVWLERGDKLWLVRRYVGASANELVKVIGTEAREGSLRLSFERINQGTTTLTWRWDLVLAVTERGPRGFVLPTGMMLADRDGVSGGWWLDVEASRSGVRLVEADGPLAWFRETGRWSWAELEARIPRWQERIGKALRQANDLVPKAIQKFDKEEMKETTVTLALLPGYVEPLRAPLVPFVFSLNR